MKYHSMQRMWECGADYCFTVGGRSNGKSSDMAIRLVEDYVKNGNQFARIVRYIFDMQDKYVANYFTNNYVSQVLKERYNCYVQYDSPYYIMIDCDNQKKKQVIGEVMSLSTEQKYKSNQYPYTNNILVEEFSLLDSTKYMDGEIDKFNSLLSTIVRKREGVRCFFIGNTVSKYNTYFDHFHINIDRLRLKPGDFKWVQQGKAQFKEPAKVAIEFAEMGYEDESEIPRILRVEDNETAVTGLYMTPPDVIDKEEINFQKRTDQFVILVGEYKFFLHVFACFCYWEMCTGSDKNRKPDAMVRTRCYELGRYFYNFISKMDPPLPKEWYYDTEWTKDYIYKNVTI